MNAVTNSTEMETWVSVCQCDDLIDNLGICVLLKQKQIAIFRLSGAKQLYAIDNYDPFSDANVLSRGICGSLANQAVLASPIYKQHFNLTTGQCLEDASIKIPVYSIREMNGSIQIATA